MRAIGIVAEYNPFHQGHSHLIRESRRALAADVCVSVMSGQFSQRGTPCLYDKWTRAEAAVRGGVDLVVELPVIYATGSAEVFARGAVSVLEGFGSIDCIAFGSESGDGPGLLQAAAFLREHEAEINRAAAALQRDGLSYPRAREQACVDIDPAFDVSLVREPNNILALEYLKWIRAMEPFTVKRSDQGYHKTGTALRNELRDKEPARFRNMEARYFDLVRYAVLRMNSEETAKIAGASGGLGDKLRKEIAGAKDPEALIDRVKSKGYTRTRICRLLTHVLLGITTELESAATPYIRVLGFNRRGAAFLKQCVRDECTQLPILTNVSKEQGRYPEIAATLAKDLLATQVYAILTGEDLYSTSDLVRKPVIAGE